MTLTPEQALAQTDVVASVSLPMRWEDVDQTGRVTLPALASALGEACWRGYLKDHPLRECERQGIVAIQSRMSARFSDASVSAEADLECEGRVTLARTERDGDVHRLLLLLSVNVYGPSSRTYAPQPDNHGERVWLGQTFQEAVFTRPFAERGARRVLALPDVGLPVVPETLVARDEALLDVASPRFSSQFITKDVTFGRVHSDANQHVNSLVYPRIFEEKVIEIDGRTDSPRALSMTFRKPSFVGERASFRIALGEDQVSGALYVEGEEKPRVVGALLY